MPKKILTVGFNLASDATQHETLTSKVSLFGLHPVSLTPA